jgi:hypothetical protein
MVVHNSHAPQNVKFPDQTYTPVNSTDQYTLQAAVLGVSNDQEHSTHVIAAFVCNKQQLVYDAQQHSIVATNWIAGDLSNYFKSSHYTRLNKFETLIYLKADAALPATPDRVPDRVPGMPAVRKFPKVILPPMLRGPAVS